jgi:hypothetical protein
MKLVLRLLSVFFVLALLSAAFIVRAGVPKTDALDFNSGNDQASACLAVDLYRGKVATDAAQAHELMRGLPQDRGIKDLKAAMTYLATRKDVKPDRLGSIGW